MGTGEVERDKSRLLDTSFARPFFVGVISLATDIFGGKYIKYGIHGGGRLGLQFPAESDKESYELYPTFNTLSPIRITRVEFNKQ